MRTTRHRRFGAALLLPFLLAHCGDDDDTGATPTPPAAGAAGAAGSAGKGGSAGSGGNQGGTGQGGAGTGGAGASQGGAGQGGAGSGGAGQGGAGSGGAGAGGAGAGGAGTGGTGGQGGASIVSKVTNATSGATNFYSPMDAVPSPDGTTIYFIAFTTDGEAAVFKVPAAGGAVTEVVKGAPLAAPTGIAITASGTTLLIADPAAAEDAENNKDAGQVFAVSVNGGLPEALVGLSGLHIRSVTAAKLKDGDPETLYFAAQGTDGAGIYSSPVAGGAVSIVASGAPFVDPSSVVVRTGGKIYATDALASGGAILEIEGTKATVFAEGLSVGYPIGVTLSQDGTQLYVSARDAASDEGTVIRYDVATKAATGSLADPAAKGLVEPAGLQRASGSGVMAWVDGNAGKTGAVFALTP